MLPFELVFQTVLGQFRSAWFSPLIIGLLITLVTKINKIFHKFASANVD